MKQIQKNRFTAIKNGNIHYLEWAGGGSVKIHFLHANGFCAGTYAPFLQRLADNGFRVLASDLRGHGDSKRMDYKKLNSWTLFSDDLIDFIQETMNPPITGIGHSLGAVTTYMAAAKRPDLFSELILIDPVIFQPVQLFIIAALRFFRLNIKVPLAQGARRRKVEFPDINAARMRFGKGHGMFKYWEKTFIESYLSCALKSLEDRRLKLKCDPMLEARIYETLPTHSFRLAKKIKCPTLLLRGEHSPTFLPGPAKILQKKIPCCDLITIKGSGHFVPMEKAEDCQKEIQNWISR